MCRDMQGHSRWGRRGLPAAGGAAVGRPQDGGQKVDSQVGERTTQGLWQSLELLVQLCSAAAGVREGTGAWAQGRVGGGGGRRRQLQP